MTALQNFPGYQFGKRSRASNRWTGVRRRGGCTPVPGAAQLQDSSQTFGTNYAMQQAW